MTHLHTTAVSLALPRPQEPQLHDYLRKHVAETTCSRNFTSELSNIPPTSPTTDRWPILWLGLEWPESQSLPKSVRTQCTSAAFKPNSKKTNGTSYDSASSVDEWNTSTRPKHKLEWWYWWTHGQGTNSKKGSAIKKKTDTTFCDEITQVGPDKCDVAPLTKAVS